MIGAEEMSEELGVSKGYAYRIIRMLNHELQAKGNFVLNGKVDRAYFEYRFFDNKGDDGNGRN